MSKERLVFFWLPQKKKKIQSWAWDVYTDNTWKYIKKYVLFETVQWGETRNAFNFLTSSEKTTFSLIHRSLFSIPAYSRENDAQFTPTRSLCKHSKDLDFVPVTLETRGAEPSRTEAHLDHSEEHCVPECAGWCRLPNSWETFCKAHEPMASSVLGPRLTGWGDQSGLT